MISSLYRRLFIAACAVACRVGPFGIREQHERHPFTWPQHAVMWGGGALSATLMVADAAGVHLGAAGAAVASGSATAAVATLLYGRSPRRPS